MRIYGTSPLFNYVELVFRCKRMFIISIILGTVITSALVYVRRENYEATLVIALSGDPALAQGMAGDKDNKVAASTLRKANRLSFWVEQDPEFIGTMLKNIGMDRGQTPEEFASLIREVRKKIEIGKTLYNGQYLMVSITWPNREQAEKILNELYSRFAEKTVQEETAITTNKRFMLEKQFQKYDAEANEKGRIRVAYIQKHWHENPERMSAEISRHDTLQQSLADYQTAIAETEARLSVVSAALAKTPKEITEQQKDMIVTDETALKLAEEREGLNQQMLQLKTRYNDSHPQVVELQKKIDALDRRIEETKNQPPKARKTGAEVTKGINREWLELNRQKNDLTQALRGYQLRLERTRAQMALSQSRVAQMPEEQRRFNEIERAYQLADNVRNQMRAQLEAARIDEERDKITQASLVKKQIEPKAEKIDAGGKGVVLYALGPLLGIIIAFCFSLVAEALDHSLRTPVEVEKYLGKPVLAVLPKIQAPREERKRLAGGSQKHLPS